MKGALALLTVALLLGPLAAQADVRSGVDAWRRGDFAAAVTAWRGLAEAGDADAQFNLGQAYRLGRGVPPDDNRAEAWLRKAALQGHARARDAYGLMLFRNGKRAEAMPYLEEAAARSEPRAQYLYATALFNGDLIGRDWVRAYALMSRAASGGLPAAKASLERMERYVSPEQRQLALRSARALTLPATAQVDEAAKTPFLAVKGSWKVQLAAFGNPASGASMWFELQRQIPALSPYRAIFVRAGTVVRLQAGPLADRRAAMRLCAVIKASGRPCIPVAP